MKYGVDRDRRPRRLVEHRIWIAILESDGSLRERQGTSPVGAGCFPDMHRPKSRTPHPARLCGLHTRRRLLQCPTRLPERLPAQRAWRARTLRFTSSQGSPAAGFFSRFAFLRASSCFCQSWTGTASGSAARSSHRSSTSWSFSEGLRSKIDAEFIRASTANSLKLPGQFAEKPAPRQTKPTSAKGTPVHLPREGASATLQPEPAGTEIVHRQLENITPFPPSLSPAGFQTRPSPRAISRIGAYPPCTAPLFRQNG